MHLLMIESKSRECFSKVFAVVVPYENARVAAIKFLKFLSSVPKCDPKAAAWGLGKCTSSSTPWTGMIIELPSTCF